MTRVPTKQLVTIILAVITLSSVTVAAMNSNNYYQFYEAIRELRLQNPSITLTPTNTSLNAYTIFTVENPTSYNGLKILQFEPSFKITANGTQVPANGLIQFTPPRDRLDPGRMVNYNISFTAHGAGVDEMYTKVENNCQCLSQFGFNFTVAIFLSTFIDTFASVRAVYACNSNIGGGSCEQITVLINSTPSSSVGPAHCNDPICA